VHPMGYMRIAGEINGLGLRVSATTVREGPAPSRHRPRWRARRALLAGLPAAAGAEHARGRLLHRRDDRAAEGCTCSSPSSSLVGASAWPAAPRTRAAPGSPSRPASLPGHSRNSPSRPRFLIRETRSARARDLRPRVELSQFAIHRRKADELPNPLGQPSLSSRLRNDLVSARVSVEVDRTLKVVDSERGVLPRTRACAVTSW
jgi:hypothetical protein